MLRCRDSWAARHERAFLPVAAEGARFAAGAEHFRPERRQRKESLLCKKRGSAVSFIPRLPIRIAVFCKHSLSSSARREHTTACSCVSGRCFPQKTAWNRPGATTLRHRRSSRSPACAQYPRRRPHGRPFCCIGRCSCRREQGRRNSYPAEVPRRQTTGQKSVVVSVHAPSARSAPTRALPARAPKDIPSAGAGPRQGKRKPEGSPGAQVLPAFHVAGQPLGQDTAPVRGMALFHGWTLVYQEMFYLCRSSPPDEDTKVNLHGYSACAGGQSTQD